MYDIQINCLPEEASKLLEFLYLININIKLQVDSTSKISSSFYHIRINIKNWEGIIEYRPNIFYLSLSKNSYSVDQFLEMNKEIDSQLINIYREFCNTYELRKSFWDQFEDKMNLITRQTLIYENTCVY